MRTSLVPRLTGSLLILALPALAQLSSSAIGSSPQGDQLTDRYEKARKGANIGEWARRLGDEDPSIRLEAVKSIGTSGDPEGIDYLLQAVGDPDARVRAKAVDYLGENRATEATFFLIQRLFMSDTSGGLRHRVLMALGKIGDPKAARPIIEFLSRDDVAPDLRGTGIYALGEIGDPEVEPNLRRMLETENDPRLSRLVQEALAKIATRRASEPPPGRAFPSALEAALRPPDAQAP